MSPDQEHRLEEVFSAARNLPPLERAAFLERACRGDTELRRQADSLLAAHEQAGPFLQQTVVHPTPISPLEQFDGGATDTGRSYVMMELAKGVPSGLDAESKAFFASFRRRDPVMIPA